MNRHPATAPARQPSTPDAPLPPHRNPAGVFLLALVLATLAAYSPALRGDFIFDDTVHISENAAVRSPAGLTEIWAHPGATPQYYPLTFSVFWLGYRLWGQDTLGYHIINVLLHAAAALLLWQVLRKLKVRGAWLAGAVFAVHPVCVMSVAWMTELKNVLSAALALGATWAYAQALGLGNERVEVGVKKSDARAASFDGRFYALALGLFLLAMLAKTAVSFLPLTLVLLTWWCGRRLNWRAIWPVLPMLGIVVVLGFVTVNVEQTSGGAGGESFHLPLAERVLVSGRSFWFYLEHALVPRLSPFLYDHWDVSASVWWQWVFPAATAAVLGAAWFFRGKIGRGPVVAGLHYFVSTSFLILLVVPYFTVFSWVSDHWQYYGLLGLIPLVAAGLVTGLRRATGGNLLLERTGYGVVLGGLWILTWLQCGMYRHGETLWQTTIRRCPDCAEAHTRYGDILFQRHDVEDALREFQTAVRLGDTDPEAHYNLGNALAQTGQMDQAKAEFMRVLELTPDSALGHNGLGKVLSVAEKYPEAVVEFQKATNARPMMVEPHLNLGNVYLKLGQAEEAKGEFQRAVELAPDSFAAHLNLGTLLARERQLDGAIQEFELAQKIQPADAMACVDLGTALAQKGLLTDAVQQFRRALEFAPTNYNVRVNLGMILWQTRQVSEAIDQLTNALVQHPELPQARDSLNRIAWIMSASPVAAMRDGPRAVGIVQLLLRVTGAGDPTLLATQAAAWAETGRFPDAVAAAQQASDLAAQEGDPEPIRNALNEQLQVYRSGQAYRDTNLGKTAPK